MKLDKIYTLSTSTKGTWKWGIDSIISGESGGTDDI